MVTEKDIKEYNQNLKKAGIQGNEIDPKRKLVRLQKPKLMTDLYVPILHSRR